VNITSDCYVMGSG